MPRQVAVSPVGRPGRLGSSGSHRYRPDIEGLRAVAVLAVVGFHAAIPGVGGGYVGVDVFYVISGFLITGLLWQELSRTGRLELSRFYARRARRLLPAATLVSVATMVAAACWLQPLRARSVLDDALAATLYAGNYRLALQGSDYLAASQPPSPFQHYWSLAVEEQFYLCWPLLLAAMWLGRRRAAPLLLGLLAAGSFWLSLRWTAQLPAWAFFSLFSRAWELAVGGLLALAGSWLTRLPRPVAGPLGWCGLATLLGSCALLGTSTPFPGTAALYPVLGAAAVIAAGSAAYGSAVAVLGGPAAGSGLQRLLGSPPLRGLGRLSYAWYLWHWPVLVFAAERSGHQLELSGRLSAASVSLGLAALTLITVENPVRRASSLSRRPRRSLLLAGSLTCAAALAVLLAARMLPDLSGHGIAAEPQLAAVAAAPDRPPARVLDRLTAQVQAALGAALRTEQVPANLRPGLAAASASADKARPFLDGCLSSWTEPEPADCFYADAAVRSGVLLMGDSHAAQWFPALVDIAGKHRFRLQVLGKSACPPLRLPVFSPYLGRSYLECAQWLSQAVAEVRTSHPRLVVLDVARHYGDVYHFTVYSPRWYAGLAETVRELRAAGAPVLVLGPIPKPPRDVPGCLSAHLRSVQRCTMLQSASLSAAGIRGERAAVLAAGGRYLDLSPLLCTAGRCPVIVGNELVYRDDNHLTTEYAAWLTPVLNAAVDSALRATPH